MRRLIALLVLICAGLIAAGQVYRQTIGNDKAKHLSTPDNSNYYLRNATVYQFDKQGNLVYRLTSARTLHFANDSARLTDIHVHYLAGSKTYWNLAAAKGRVPAGQRKIYLYDGVTAHHPRRGGQIVRVTTDNAWIYPDANRIDSKAHVTARDPGQTLEGDGFTVNLNTDQLKILKNVQVIYTQ